MVDQTQRMGLSATLAVIVWLSMLGHCSAMLDTDNDKDIELYLRQFGYALVAPSHPQNEAAALQRDFNMTESLMTLQETMGLPVTGELDSATVTLMRTPRCGNTDEDIIHETHSRKKRFITRGGKWASKAVSWRIKDYSQKLTETEQEFDVRKALKMWSDNSGLTFTHSRTANTADIQIRFASRSHGDGLPFDGRSGVLAHAFFPSFGGDAHFDEDENWTRNSRVGSNLFLVAAHEFGHSLGLAHSNVKDSLMFPYYRGYDPDFTLFDDDIHGIQRLYGPPPDAPPPTPSPTPPTPASTRPPATTRTPAPTPTPMSTATPRPTAAPTVTARPPNENSALCDDGRFDTITRFDEGQTYAFRGSQYMHIDDVGVASGYPRRIRDDWPDLPDDVGASLWRPPVTKDTYNQTTRTFETTLVTPGRTYIFKDFRVWLYTADPETKQPVLTRAYPKVISYEFPGVPNDIDAAFIWGRNRRVYFIKGSQYYRWRDDVGVEVGYPRPLSIWRGLPNTITSAFLYKNGKTYFFNGKEYYRFLDEFFRVDNGYPRHVDYWWMGCGRTSNLIDAKPEEGVKWGGVEGWEGPQIITDKDVEWSYDEFENAEVNFGDGRTDTDIHDIMSGFERLKPSAVAVSLVLMSVGLKFIMGKPTLLA